MERRITLISICLSAALALTFCFTGTLSSRELYSRGEGCDLSCEIEKAMSDMAQLQIAQNAYLAQLGKFYLSRNLDDINATLGLSLTTPSATWVYEPHCYPYVAIAFRIEEPDVNIVIGRQGPARSDLPAGRCEGKGFMDGPVGELPAKIGSRLRPHGAARARRPSECQPLSFREY